MMFPSILFFMFAATLIAAALGVILARNPVYSALLLVLCFFNSAVIWLLLDAEFLGIVLVLVYVGAVMVLFLFVVMMLDVNLEELRKGLANYWPLSVAVARLRDWVAAAKPFPCATGTCTLDPGGPYENKMVWYSACGGTTA